MAVPAFKGECEHENRNRKAWNDNMAISMNTKWKQMFVWSSIGGVVLGAAVTIARKKRKDANRPITCRKIPVNCQRFSVWTERFSLEEGGKQQFAHDHYDFEATPFRVWSVLDLADADKRPQDGASVYHVTHIRTYERWEGGDCKEEECVLERFYGAVSAIGNDGKSCGRNMIARGGALEIRKCLVGGASNGVETGERHRSEAKILNYHWDLTPIPETAREQ
jgi:hypothetical protein